MNAWRNRFEWLRSQHEGIFLSRVGVGDQVKQGDTLGEMVDLLGNRVATIVSPAHGVLLFTVTSPAIKRDGLLLGIGVPE